MKDEKLQWFRYVRFAEVPQYEEEGWESLDGLTSCHHGHYSTLMRWTGTGEPPCRNDSSTSEQTTKTAQAG
jgi:hypothetical protein